MFTADNITDEQIRELRDALNREHRGRAGRARVREMMAHISDALRGEDNQRYRGAYYNARCYVAGMLNARTNDTRCCEACLDECDSKFMRDGACHDPRHETPCRKERS